MILVFWMLSFKPAFSLSSVTLIKRLFSSYWHSAIRVVSSAYLRLLIFLPAILIPPCDSYNLAFHLIIARWASLSCLLICFIISSWPSRHQPAHLLETRQLSRTTPACSTAWYSPAEPRDTLSPAPKSIETEVDVSHGLTGCQPVLSTVLFFFKKILLKYSWFTILC